MWNCPRCGSLQICASFENEWIIKKLLSDGVLVEHEEYDAKNENIELKKKIDKLQVLVNSGIAKCKYGKVSSTTDSTVRYEYRITINIEFLDNMIDAGNIDYIRNEDFANNCHICGEKLDPKCGLLNNKRPSTDKILHSKELVLIRRPLKTSFTPYEYVEPGKRLDRIMTNQQNYFSFDQDTTDKDDSMTSFLNCAITIEKGIMVLKEVLLKLYIEYDELNPTTTRNKYKIIKELSQKACDIQDDKSISNDERQKKIDYIDDKIEKIEKLDKSVQNEVQDAIAYNFIKKEITNAEYSLKQHLAVKNRLQETKRIYPKYYDIATLTTIYEYFSSKRCDDVAGPYGAYNMYEMELKMKKISNKLDDIHKTLDQIKENQYETYLAISEVDKSVSEINKAVNAASNKLRDISNKVNNVSWNMAALKSISEVSLYYDRMNSFFLNQSNAIARAPRYFMCF